MQQKPPQEFFLEGNKAYKTRAKEMKYLIYHNAANVFTFFTCIFYLASASPNLRSELFFCICFIQIPTLIIFYQIVVKKTMSNQKILKLNDKVTFLRLVVSIVLFFIWYHLQFNIYKPYLYVNSKQDYKLADNCQIIQEIQIPNSQEQNENDQLLNNADEINNKIANNKSFIEKYSILEIEIQYTENNEKITQKGYSCLSDMKHEYLPSISTPAPYSYESLEFLTKNQFDIPLKIPSWKCLMQKETESSEILQELNEKYSEEIQNCYFIPYTSLYTQFEDQYPEYLDNPQNFEVIFERQGVPYYPKFQFYIHFFVFFVLQFIFGFPALANLIMKQSKVQDIDLKTFLVKGESYGTIRTQIGGIEFLSIKSIKLTAIDKNILIVFLSKLYKVHPSQFHFVIFECGGSQNQIAFQIQIITPKMRLQYQLSALKKRFNLKNKQQYDLYHKISNDMLKQFMDGLIIKSQKTLQQGQQFQNLEIQDPDLSEDELAQLNKIN